MKTNPLLLTLICTAPALAGSWLGGPSGPEARGFRDAGENRHGRRLYRHPLTEARMVLVPGSPPLLVGEAEVTVAEYARFLRAADEERRPRLWPAQLAAPGRPVLEVDWRQARAFCTWAGGRLPSDAEWSHFAGAPRREQGYVANWNGDPAYARWKAWDALLRPARSDRHDVSPFGIHDVGGSLYEWCSDEEEPGGRRLLRGGNFVGRTDVRVYYWVRPEVSNRDIGFRLVVPLD